MTRRWETALLAIAFAIAGLVALTLVFAGPATYETLARDTPFAPATFRETGGGSLNITTSVPLAQLVDYHERWLAYVTGRAPSPPSDPGVVLFTRDEYAHMADVRRVFVGFEVAALAGLAVAAAVLRRAAHGARLTLTRDAAIAAGLGVGALAAVAAVAFDSLFLAFHEVFFPQGNFLFGPDSNLIAMYPDAYWSGVTLRIGVAFVAASAIVAIGATATLGSRRR